jgi:hypothetical protein
METATLAEELGHLKKHVMYPATRAQVVAACNNMSHIDTANRDWFTKNLPAGTYRNPAEILSALLTKV